MTPSNPTCSRCGKEIVPGQNVEFVGMSDEEIAEQRIFTEDLILIVHADAADCEPKGA